LLCEKRFFSFSSLSLRCPLFFSFFSLFLSLSLSLSLKHLTNSNNVAHIGAFAAFAAACSGVLPLRSRAVTSARHSRTSHSAALGAPTTCSSRCCALSLAVATTLRRCAASDGRALRRLANDSPPSSSRTAAATAKSAAWSASVLRSFSLAASSCSSAGTATTLGAARLATTFSVRLVDLLGAATLCTDARWPSSALNLGAAADDDADDDNVVPFGGGLDDDVSVALSGAASTNGFFNFSI
jgi:hypothetical protein